MRFRARSALVLLAAGLTLGAPSARAGTVWQWTHQAEGEGRAQVYDGGPAVFDLGSVSGPDDPSMNFGAFDVTGPGTDGASFRTKGRSTVAGLQRSLNFAADFSTSYWSRTGPDADHPGGEGEGWLWSVVEFVMPVDELEWMVEVDIWDTNLFAGSTLIVVENVTTSTVLAEITDEPGFFRMLTGQTGDVIRITTEMSGQGGVPVGGAGSWGYRTNLSMWFLIPEPATSALLALGALLLSGRAGRRVSGRCAAGPAILTSNALGGSLCNG